MEESLIGKAVGPCRIEAKLGAGGMGQVYRAHHIPLDRPVAVKVLLPSLLTRPGMAEALIAEARLAAALEDPHIVRVYDVGSQGSIHYIIMQLVEGETLEQKVLRDGVLAPKDAVRCAKEILLGLAAAHAKGIIHRDLKPSNVLVDKAGAVYLTDFGLAARARQGAAATSGGTFHFMAPEQAFGWEPDPPCDLYSLGVSLYYLLTGRLPYHGKSQNDIMVQHRDAPIPDVRELNGEVTGGFAALIMRLMAKSPQGRPATAMDAFKEFNAPGLFMELDPSGSPFRILAPKPERKEGFVPPEAAAPPEEPVRPPQEASLPTAADLPPSPPALPRRNIRPTWLSRLIFLAIYGFFFGPRWSGLVPADWLGGAVFAGALASAVYFGDRRRLSTKLGAAGAVAAMMAAFYRYGMGAAWVPPAAPSLELSVSLGFAALLGLCSIFLELFNEDPSRALPLGLLAASAALWLASAAALRLGADFSLAGLVPVLVGDLTALAGADGVWRWGGLALLVSSWGIFFPRAQAKAGPVVNWNK